MYFFFEMVSLSPFCFKSLVGIRGRTLCVLLVLLELKFYAKKICGPSFGKRIPVQLLRIHPLYRYLYYQINY